MLSSAWGTKSGNLYKEIRIRISVITINARVDASESELEMRPRLPAELVKLTNPREGGFDLKIV